jgi:endonuclease/exonuclease/phosphatase family metal-dependent hydrolase
VTSGTSAPDETTSEPAEGPYGPLLEGRVRVVSWNLWWRFGPWEARQPAIEATLGSLQPDVACLQEVWQDGDRSLAAELAERLGYHHVYASRLDIGGVAFGNAVLSRWPIASSDVLPLPAPDDLEELRTCLRADIEGPRGPLQVFCTPLNWSFDQSHVRQAQVRAIASFVATSRPEAGRTFPPVLCGDFNADPGSDELRMLTGSAATPEPGLVFHDAWHAAAVRVGAGGEQEGEDGGRTWTNDNPYAAQDLEPDRRIDYVLVGWPKRGGAGHVTRCEVHGLTPVEGVVPSDHLAVLAELRY